jgi:DivIVA domain-containing protein
MASDDLHDQPESPRFRGLSSTLPREVPDEELRGIRDVSFPIVMRGYDRAAVDAYVTRVNRIIAELQVTRSPQSAIRHALDQMSEETKGILERAHQSAEEIAARSRSQADDRVQRAEQEARTLIDDAEARVRELDSDADAVRQERNRLIEDIRRVSDELQALASDASTRFPPEPGEPEAQTQAIDVASLQPESEGARAEPAEPIEAIEPAEDEDSPSLPPPPPPPQ